MTYKPTAPDRIWRVAAYLPEHNAHGLASWPRKAHAGEGATEYVLATALADRDAVIAELMDALTTSNDYLGSMPLLAISDQARSGVLDRLTANLIAVSRARDVVEDL